MSEFLDNIRLVGQPTNNVWFRAGENATESSGYNYVLEAQNNNGLLLGYSTSDGTNIRYLFDVTSTAANLRIRNGADSSDKILLTSVINGVSYINNGGPLFIRATAHLGQSNTKFGVNGESQFNDTIWIGGGTGDGFISFSTGTNISIGSLGSNYSSYRTSAYHQFQVSSVDKMVISSNGVGINQNPTNAFDATVGASKARITSTSTGSNNSFEIFDSNYGLSFAVEGVYGRVKIGAGYTTFSSTLMVGDYGLSNFMHFGTDGVFGRIQRASTGLYFTGFDTGDGVQFRLNSDLALDDLTAYFKNRVGIGTMGPVTKFAVAHSNNNSTNGITVDNTFGSGWGSRLAFRHDVGSGMYVGSAIQNEAVISGGQLTLWTANTSSVLTERVRINNLGNVGIGGNPTYRLHVFGNQFVQDEIAFGNANTYIMGATSGPFFVSGDTNTLAITNGVGSIQYYVNGNSNDADHVFLSIQNGQGSILERVRFRNNGQVKIAGLADTLNSPPQTRVVLVAPDGTLQAGVASGSAVDGVGTTNYISKWVDTNTLTDSSMQDDGTDVTVNANIVLESSKVIKSTNGQGQIDLDLYGTGNDVMISTDAAGYTTPYIELYSASPGTGHYLDINGGLTSNSALSIFTTNAELDLYEINTGAGRGVRLRYSTPNYVNNVGSAGQGAMGIQIIGDVSGTNVQTYRGILIKDITSNSLISRNSDQPGIIIGSKNSQINSSLVNTVVIGGSNITATLSNVVYIGNDLIVTDKIDTTAWQLRYSASLITVDWADLKLFNSLGNKTVDWGSNTLFYPNGTDQALTWNSNGFVQVYGTGSVADLFGMGTGDLRIGGDPNGTAGNGIVLKAYNGSGGWRTGLEYKNVASGSEPDLVLVPSQGSVYVGDLQGTDDRIVEANPAGKLSATRTIITTYGVPNSEKLKLEDPLNWDINGEYIGTAITGTYQGQKHYDDNYFYEAVADNYFIRLIRG